MSSIGWLIIFCEIAFWVVIILGLVTRYLWGREKLGLFFLALTPIVDLILLIATSVDLARGATATSIHGIAAIYIGTSIAYGKSMIAWADECFQYYITKKGTKPLKRYGMEYAKHQMKGWIKHVFAYLIGAGLLVVIIYVINDSTRTEALSQILKIWTLALGINLVISSSYFIWPRKLKIT